MTLKLFSKSEVKFEHPARMANRCKDCIYWLGPSRCAIVLGQVFAQDWCKMFRRSQPEGKAR